MTKIPRLTKESEERISSALTKVAALTNAGESPNDAIVKVATERKIPVGHVRLMVRAFNNGRSLGHIRNHEKLTEKAASFTLADASEVLERMFPSQIKTPAEKAAAAAVANDYNLSPEGWLRRRAKAEQRAALTKVAADRGSEESKALPYPDNPLRAGRKALSKIADLRREHQMVKDAAIAACYGVADTVNAVGDYFRRPDHRPVAEIMANASAAFGPAGTKLVEHAASMTKVAAGSTAACTHAFSWEEEPYSLIKAALDAMTDFNTKRSALDTLEAELPEKRAETLRPFGLGPETDVIVGSVWDNQSQTKEAAGLLGLGIAGFMGGSARGMAGNIAPKSQEELVQDKLQELGSPEHEDKLRAIRVRTMIHEMMVDDPVISGYDPEAVMEAYNHLSEVAPRAMQQRVMAQALVRKFLEQASAIDPFDVDQLLDVEGKITDRDMPQQLMANQAPGPYRELGPPMSKPQGITQQAPESDPSAIDTALKGSSGNWEAGMETARQGLDDLVESFKRKGQKGQSGQ